MRNLPLVSLCASVALLTACAGGPPPAPDWQANAFAALKGYTAAYLSGNTRLADFEFNRAKAEIASTGRTDLAARAELTRCATRVASLEFDNCAGYQPLAQDAAASEKAYATFLNGRWTGIDAALLPPQHRAVVQTTGQGATSVLSAIEDPLSRLVAAGALLQARRLAPQDVVVATDTASNQGWRRPLLAWLGVQLQAAQTAGDKEGAARLQRRIDLVLQTAPKTPSP
ncbi:hypothetical protein [Rhodoferax saidenbachensis]|nr:hypothetical protein [Rhodoferax saidenbachensis]